MTESALLMTPVGRIIYPSIFEKKEPYDNSDGKKKPQYEVTILWPKGTDMSVLTNAIKAEIKDSFSGKPEGVRSPVQDMDKVRELVEQGVLDQKMPADYTRGMFKATFRNRFELAFCFGPRKEPIEDTEVYSGCWGRVAFDTWSYDYKSRGIALNLLGFQKAKDDETIGGTSIDTDQVGELPVEEDSDSIGDLL